MSSLYKDKRTGIWHFKIMISGKRKDISTKLKNLRDAKLYIKKYEEMVKELPAGIKLAPLLSACLKHYVTVNDIRYTTKELYKKSCEHFIDAAGEKRIDEYTIMDYEKFINYFDENNYSETSKGIYTRALFVIFNYYKKNEYIKKNPITAIRKIEKPKPIDVRELEVITKYIKKTDAEFFKVVRFALLTGFRRSTITEPLTIDLKRKVILARNVKGGREFQFPIYSELEKFLKSIGIRKFYIGKITKLKPDTISHKFLRVIQALLEKEKIKNKYKFHCLRHTAATGWGRQGLDINSVKTLLDHTDIRTSENYIETDYTYIKSKLS